MYQCQMAKQTMGHSCYTWRYRADPKSFRLLTPQSPLVRTKTYMKYDVDHYPLGFNAVVAVMAYTGYDMEDAMVINKSSYQRGFAGACIYKSFIINLSKLSKGKNSLNRNEEPNCFFGASDGRVLPGLDSDGFPPIGARMIPGVSLLYAYSQEDTKCVSAIKYESGEQIAYVDSVSLNGSWYQATITLRIPRPPDIGDKYSSRHGQKGINSLLLPNDEMPWTVDSGMVPDLIFNPHGFPTRMTMGMMIEFLAGKSAALEGRRIDATPFQWTEANPPFHDYAQSLAGAGFNYWGTEAMISGSTGRQLEAHIFIGIVYYQRLRHMVADKYQVRSVGPIDPVLRQPIKGRKRGGGIRLGEMERDCLLSHGAVFTLHDRLVESNSDIVQMFACSNCGGLVHAGFNRSFESAPLPFSTPMSDNTSGSWICRMCNKTNDKDANCESLLPVQVSAAFRYLTYELACLGIRTRLGVSPLA